MDGANGRSARLFDPRRRGAQKLIGEYQREEEELSYRRRLLHGRIDILRAELVDRIKRRHGDDGVTARGRIDRLTDILAHKGPPPEESEQG